jgi:hypothetical protein
LRYSFVDGGLFSSFFDLSYYIIQNTSYIFSTKTGF